MEMNGGTKSGVSTISLGRLQCIRRDSAGPTDRQKKKKKGEELLTYLGDRQSIPRGTSN
jgi:hypothetical protein